MRPYYEHAGITIFHGDCREVLPQLADIDLILTDAPYGVSYQTARRSDNDPLRCPVAEDGDLSLVREVWPLAIDSLARDRHWYVFASPRRVSEMQSIVGGKHILCWDKGNQGTVGDLVCGFGESWEAIFYGMKGRRALIGSRPRTVIRHDWSSTMDNNSHPTVKPINLLKRLIKWSSIEGEIVLDFAMGSGTTLKAAKEMGRRAIGIEIEERYCEIAAKRLSQEVFDFGVAV